MLVYLATYHLATIYQNIWLLLKLSHSSFKSLQYLFVHITLNVNRKVTKHCGKMHLRSFNIFAWTPFIIKAFICMTCLQELLSEVFKTSKK